METMRTNPTITPALAKSLAVSICLVLALGCGLRKAETAYNEGRYSDALDEYRAALRKDSKNIKAKIGYQRTAPLAAEEHLKRARAAQKAGRDEVVRSEVGAAVVLDPSNSVALDWLTRIEQSAERKRLKQESEESVDAERIKGEGKAILPINPRSLEGMDLNFTRKTSLREIFLQLSKNSGVNIILHASASAQDVPVSVDLRGLTFQRILDTLMLQSDLFYKVLDPNSIMVFKRTPQNLQEYENKLIKTFYLSNAEVESVRSTFNSIMPQLRLFIDKRLNAITIMAKPNDLTIAQRIVSQLDKAKAEVMIYMELLEVTQKATEQVGLLPVINPSDTTGTYRMGATLNSSTGLNTNKGALRISKSDLQFLFPSLALDMLKTNGDGKLLASPNIRVISGEEGTINIGDKISTTQSSLSLPGASAATNTAVSSALGGVSAAQTQYGYEDVGVRIKVKPRVHYNGDITLELDTEIKTMIPGSVSGRPDLSQRVIKTQARLMDGETAVFGGLLKEDDLNQLQGLWGITDIPLIGKLLGNTKKERNKKDVILTIRAVIVRRPDLHEEDFEAFDPDQDPNANKPFAPKPDKAGLHEAAGVKPGPPPTVALAKVNPEASAPAVVPPPPAATPAPIPAPAVVVPAPAATTQPAPGEAATPTQPAAEAPKEVASTSELVFFMDPMSGTAPKGKPVRVTIYASGGQGVTGGTMELLVDPKLKLNAISPGDFITADAGTLTQAVGTNGTVLVTFKRRSGASDSGILATLDLEGVTPGKGTVLIQGGQYLVGANPISARVVNAMITVE
jgi:type II secretory pathway component GspD/PulD (secretin)